MMDIGKMVTRLIEAGCDPVVAARTLCDAFECGRQQVKEPAPVAPSVHAVVHTSVAPDEIQRAACEYFGIAPVDLARRCRERQYVRRRWLVVHLYRDLTTLSLPAIGRRLGNMDHSSILYSDREATKLIANDPEFRATYSNLRARLADQSKPEAAVA